MLSRKQYKYLRLAWCKVGHPVTIKIISDSLQISLFCRRCFAWEIFKSSSSSSSSRRIKSTESLALSLSHHPSTSAIALGKSTRRHPVFVPCWWMKIFASQWTLVCLCVGVHKRTSLMSSSLLLQQCHAYLARLEWFVRWEVSGCITVVLYDAASRTCSKEHESLLGSFLLAFSQSVSLKSKRCNHAVILTGVVLYLSRYFIMALSPWLPRAFSGSLFFNTLYAYVVFERSTDGVCHILSRVSSDFRDESLEQVAWLLATQRQEQISVNN